jgi:4'-phosphopantetheinyl transferase
MKIVERDEVPFIAGQLRNDEIHVWRLFYRRQQKRGPLMQLLGAYLDLPGDGVALIDGEFGRPSLDPAHGALLGFNWSHSGEHALVAVGRNLAPGIDIERRRQRHRALDIAEHYFHKEEYAGLIALPSEARSDAFLELWTAKEAVLKALGRGIAFGLDRLHVLRKEGRLELRWLDDDIASAWQLQGLDAGEDYRAALAWRGAARQVRCWSVDL